MCKYPSSSRFSVMIVAIPRLDSWFSFLYWFRLLLLLLLLSVLLGLKNSCEVVWNRVTPGYFFFISWTTWISGLATTMLCSDIPVSGLFKMVSMVRQALLSRINARFVAVWYFIKLLFWLFLITVIYFATTHSFICFFK